jgi:ribulose-5-phosphate 4-epimerase/fuculose-1-phosphate aldolase
VSHFGWDDLIYTHISAKIPGTETFLINEYGLRFEEITSSNLVKVDINGGVIGEGVINPAGFVIHGTIHQARHDAGCIIHIHTPAGIAVSADRRGLLPISQPSSFIVSNVAYHDYYGLIVDDTERELLKANLGNKPYLILRNHGLLTVGNTIPIAFMNMYSLQKCCESQVLTDLDHANLISNEILEQVFARAKIYSNSLPQELYPKFREWQALLRLLDAKDSTYKE